MSPVLHQLAREGSISWLSYYFAEFIRKQDGSDADSLLAHSAALVSEANLAGNVCVELAYYNGRVLFPGRQDLQIPQGPPAADWTRTLLASDCVGKKCRLPQNMVSLLQIY